MDDFPSNRQTRPEPQRPPRGQAAESKRIAKVVEGEVIRRRKPLGKRFREVLIGDGTTPVWEYVLLDVLVPQAKDMIADAASTSVERLLFGEVRSTSRRGHRIGNGYTPYNRFSQSPVNNRGNGFLRNDRDDDRVPLSRRARSQFDFAEVVIPSRVEAVEVLEGMFMLLEKYEQVKVSDLYELLGVSAQYTDERYGWTDLRGASVQRVREGYLLDVPRPEPLER